DSTTTLSGAAVSYSGAQGNDSLTVLITGGGNYASKDVGTGLSYSLTSLVLSGTDSNDYVLSCSTFNGSNGVITPAPLTVLSASNVSKVYDSTTTLSGAAVSYSGAQGNDSLTVLITGGGNYANKDVGTGLSYSLTSLVLSGTDSNDYILSCSTFNGSNGIITPATLTLQGATVSKTYDSTITISGANLSYSGAMGNDSQTVLITGSGNYAGKGVGTGLSYVLNTLTLSGTDSNDYVLSCSIFNGTDGVINAAPLVISGFTADDKVYDGITSAVMNNIGATFTGLIGHDDVYISGLVGTFSDSQVGTGKTVTLIGTIAGTDASNYMISTQSTTTANITPLPLSLTFSGNNKTYDGTTVATVTVASNIITGDLVTLSYNSAFTTASAGANKTISISNINLTGAHSGDYSLVPSSACASASILPAPLMITANNLSANYSGVPFKGGNGVVYHGFVPGEDSTVLEGVLLYGGNSQGAIASGGYVISLSGLSSLNYMITFVNGHLLILPQPVNPNAQRGETFTLYPDNRFGVQQMQPMSQQNGGADNSSDRISALGLGGGVEVRDEFGHSLPPGELLLKDLNEQTQGLIVPLQVKSQGTWGGVLPQMQLQMMSGSIGGIPILTMPGGGPIPDWIHFNPHSLAIDIPHLPKGVLPLHLEIHMADKVIPVTITQETLHSG
ncbi:MAG: YDG domain-containing protein, partial [Enterobacteriaceae bacterium]